MGAQTDVIVRQMQALADWVESEVPAEDETDEGRRVPWITIRTRLEAAIERWAPPESAYVRSMRATRDEPHIQIKWQIVRYGLVLSALKADYEDGLMQTVEELVHANVFADFLDMGSELHEKGYKDPAAVIAGSVLEEHIRKLAQRNAVSVERDDGQPKKADTLNADLVKVNAYNKLEQKSVTAWLGLRNSAAHGKYDEYDAAQVGALIASVRDFMVRHPA